MRPAGAELRFRRKLLRSLAWAVEDRATILTTDVLQPVFKERRSLKVLGTFSDTASCKGIVYALLAYHNTRWMRASYRIEEVASAYQKAA